MRSESIAYGSTGINPDDGLPPFTPQHLNYPQVNTKCNLSYQVQVAEFQLLDGVHSLHTPQPSIVERIANEKVIHSEDLVLMIQMVLIETIASVDLRGKLYVERGSFIVDDSWNIVLVRRPSGAEAAVFAVVTDDIDVTSVEDSWVQAQVLDYLVKMASYSGQKYAFGGVTNYQHWRFCCLPDTEELAVSDFLTLQDRKQNNIAFSTSSRGVTSSQTFRFNSPELVYALETLLLRAYYSPIVPRASLATHTGMYLDITQDRWQWMVVTCEASASLFYPDTSSTWYTLLYHVDNTYHQGNLWLARTDTGAIVTLKFPARAQRSWSACVVEAGVWMHVWGVAVRTVRLLETVALELPFVYQCALEEVQQQDAEEAHIAPGEAVEEHETVGSVQAAAAVGTGVSPELTASLEHETPHEISKEKKKCKWTLRRLKKKQQARAAAAATATATDTNATLATGSTSGPSKRASYRCRLYFRGLAISPYADDSASTSLAAQQLKGLTAQLLRLAADPLGIARAALSHLVLHRGLCLHDEDVKWSNIGVLPQPVHLGHPVQEIGQDDEQGDGQEDRVNPVTVRLVPVVTELSRLQVVIGGPEQAQASLSHMLDLLETQLRNGE